MAASANRKIFAATFPNPEGGSRAAGAIAGALPEKIGNTAVLYVKPDGEVKFTEARDWGAGRGALVGGAIGILGGPPGMLLGGGIGALASKLRDSGFPNDELEQLGETLGPNSSAVVVEMAADAIKTAESLLEALQVKKTIVADIDASVATLFESEAQPVPEPDAAATPAGS